MKSLQGKVYELTKNGAEPNPTTNSDSNVNNTKQKVSNPFKDVFKEMNNSNSTNSMLNLLGGLNNDSLGSEDEQIKNVGKLYEVLTKLSNKDGDKSNPENQQELYHLFEDLLEFLLKSEILAEPLSQIRISVVGYLEKNKDKLEKDKEEKYKTTLGHIDTILSEISKPEVNKALLIDTFYKLNEMNDFDSEILKDTDQSFKEFSQLFKK
jgi:hypothetical protein